MSGLYIHIPFCEKKCNYCSFPVVIAQSHHVERYVSALLLEARSHKQQKYETVYLGGGTPSLLPLDQLERLVVELQEIFDISSAQEWSVEVNPENCDYERIRSYKDLGITRVSLGAQSMNDSFLGSLGRIHTHKTVSDAAKTIKRAGIEDINLDVMFALPGQVLADVKKDIELILALGGTHISAYSLTVEENSCFYVRKIAQQSRKTNAAMYEYICYRLKEAGYEHYEVSNFAQPGFMSRHNMNYWQGGNYLGLGMGAHSHQDGKRRWNVQRFKDYLNRIEEGLTPVDGQEILTPERRMRETLVFGLRMNQGIDIEKLQKRYDATLSNDVLTQIEAFKKAGWLEKEGPVLRVTASGRIVLDSLSVYLI